MATIRKRGANWQVQITLKGHRKSETFRTKAQASAWATATEHDILSGTYKAVANKTVEQLFDRYSEEKSTTKPGCKWEQLRINLYKRLFPDIMKLKLDALSAEHLATMRDTRLKSVTPDSYIRERRLFSNVFNVAVKEWKWLQVNPLSDVAKPKESEPRDRRITNAEIELLTFTAGYMYDEPPITVGARVGAMFLFAIETAMRCKEMCILRWDYVDYAARTASVPKKTVTHTKTGARTVPLSPEAIRILKQLEQVRDGDLVFNLKEAQVDANFRKYKTQSLIEGLHFHDTKHEAITRLAKKLSIYDLARAVGTRNLKTLMGYYNTSASDIAKLLDPQ